MEKVLNQDEIDAMFRAAAGRGAAAAAAAAPACKPCDFRQAGQIKKEQVHAISNLHEGFARNLENALGAYLRTAFEVNLVSVEQLMCGEFLPRIPDLAYLATFQVNPMGAVAVVDLETSLVFPIVDLLLGGVGRMNEQEREITEIEEGIMEGVMRILCSELQSAWSSLEASFEFTGRLQPAQLQRLLPPNEKTLCLSFEIQMPEPHGVMNVVFPAVASNALLRRLEQDGGYSRQHSSGAARERMRQRALEFGFEFSLSTPPARFPVRRLLELAPGDVLAFPLGAAMPVTASVAGCALYEALPMRAGNQRASKISRIVPAAQEILQEQ
jgi:flagellar motor switch protein FliM